MKKEHLKDMVKKIRFMGAILLCHPKRQKVKGKWFKQKIQINDFESKIKTHQTSGFIFRCPQLTNDQKEALIELERIKLLKLIKIHKYGILDKIQCREPLWGKEISEYGLNFRDSSGFTSSCFIRKLNKIENE